MHFFTSITTLLLATLALGAVIDTRSENIDTSSATCSDKGGACVEGTQNCCEGLTCFVPPQSGWVPQGSWTSQGACI